jgi:hypothetical protein
VKFYNLAENKTQLGTTFADKTALDVKKAATDAGLIDGQVDPKDIIVGKFVGG